MEQSTSRSSLGCKAFCIVFFVFWSICWNSLVHFKNCPEYLTIHLGVVAFEKGAFGSPSTMVANLYTYSPSARVKEGIDYMYSNYLCFLLPLGWYFSVTLIVFSLGDEQFRRAQLFCISYRLRLPGILLVLFWIITSSPTINDTVVVLRCHI